jgi:SAM-dependent methyltransferase
MDPLDQPAHAAKEQYKEDLAAEGTYWDNYIAQRLLLGEIPGSADFRLFFTQLSHRYGGVPPSIGGVETNFRRQEINYVLTSAVRKPGARVLDLGCGAGWLSLELARLGAHVTAVDISLTNLQLARHMAETNERNFPYLYQNFAGLICSLEQFGSVEYLYGDLNEISLPANEYDAVVVWDSLHHIRDLERLFEQVRTTLKPDGLFVGVDHSFATERTQQFNHAWLPWLADLYAWIDRANPEWLYEGVNALAGRADWGVLALENAAPTLPNSGPFLEQVRREMLDVIRSSLVTLHEQSHSGQAQVQIPGADQSTLDNTGLLDRLTSRTLPGTGNTEHEVSPFEDVSADRVMRVMLEMFEVEDFHTICPFIAPERFIPGYDAEVLKHRSVEELTFQHYLASILIKIGERAIASSRADGQWFLFHVKPGRPTQNDLFARLAEIRESKSAIATSRGAFAEAQLAELHRQLDETTDELGRIASLADSYHASLQERDRYIAHLEAEVSRKNAALDELAAIIRERDKQGIHIRLPRLPWNRRK